MVPLCLGRSVGGRDGRGRRGAIHCFYEALAYEVIIAMNSVALCESEWKVLHLGERSVSIWETIGQNSVQRPFWGKEDSVRDTVKFD